MTERSSLGTDTPIPSPGNDTHSIALSSDLPQAEMHRISLEMGCNETK